jgi:predicted small lipoprotein YifL
MKFKKLLAAMSVVLSVFMLAGCGQKSTTTSSEGT